MRIGTLSCSWCVSSAWHRVGAQQIFGWLNSPLGDLGHLSEGTQSDSNGDRLRLSSTCCTDVVLGVYEGCLKSTIQPER